MPGDAPSIRSPRGFGLLQPAHIPAHIAERKRVHGAGALTIDPIIGRAKTTLAEHARRDHDTLAFAAGTPISLPFSSSVK